MPKIINNRLCYNDHNVVCNPTISTMQYMMEMAATLSESGTMGKHRAELTACNNNGTWTIERPMVTLSLFHANEVAERLGHIPTKVLAVVTLFNGSFQKVMHVVHCARSESFAPLWKSMYQAKIRIGKAQHTEAETEYFKKYDAAVAAYNERNTQDDPACFV